MRNPADPRSSFAEARAEASWLEPFPDSWLPEAAEDPEALYSRRESVSLVTSFGFPLHLPE